jgi:hypothetical protein
MTRWQIIWFSLLGIITVGVFVWVVLGSFNVCTEGTDEIYQKTIAALDAIVELSVKLSTALIGLGAALLIGLKTGLKFTPVTKLITITASVLRGIWFPSKISCCPCHCPTSAADRLHRRN